MKKLICIIFAALLSVSCFAEVTKAEAKKIVQDFLNFGNYIYNNNTIEETFIPKTSISCIYVEDEELNIYFIDSEHGDIYIYSKNDMYLDKNFNLNIVRIIEPSVN